MPPLMQSEDPFILTREAIKVLSVDTRLDILKLLDERPHTLTEIKDALELAPATVSEHLARLEDAGLIEKRDEGRKWKYYALTLQGQKLFTKKPATFTFAFVLSTVAAGGFAIASMLRAQTQEAPMVRGEPVMDTFMAEAVPIAETAPSPDWLLITAGAFAVLSLILLVFMLAKRLKRA